MQNKWLFIFLFFFAALYGKEVKTVAFYTKNIAKVSNKDVQIAIRKVLDLGSEQSGIELKEAFPTKVEDIMNGFISGKYALITLNTYDVIRNYNKILPYIGKIWTITKTKKSPDVRYLLLVKKEAEREKKDLFRGGDIALLSFDYMQRIYLDSYLLQKYHQESGTFFHKVKYFSTSSQVILKLFFSKVEACIMSEHAYNIAIELNPQLKKSLFILAKSEKIFPSVGLTISRKGENEIAKLYDNFTHDKKDIKTFANVLMLYKAEAIVYFSPEEMDRLEKFYQHYLELKHQYE